MVKTASARTKTTQTKNQPIVTVLRMKAMLRANLLNPSKENTIASLKDEAAKTIINGFELDMRQRLNAWECWRELYYTFFKNNQEFVTQEEASTPYILQVYTKQPYEGF
jgi:hypothetical protein